MDPVQTQEHWNEMYSSRQELELSWFEETPAVSIELLLSLPLDINAPILDVGGGTARLVDALLDRGFTQPAVLDISAEALEKSKERLGSQASQVRWIVADITTWQPDKPYRAWHDRAVFHFLTTEEQRRAYCGVLERAVAPGGTVVIGTFALDGPERCSGLPVQRYSSQTLAAELGPVFVCSAACSVDHRTPAGKVQRFQFCRFERT